SVSGVTSTDISIILLWFFWSGDKEPLRAVLVFEVEALRDRLDDARSAHTNRVLLVAVVTDDRRRGLVVDLELAYRAHQNPHGTQLQQKRPPPHNWSGGAKQSL